jgi:uncharacterized protein YbaR (Trm112 family)
MATNVRSNRRLQIVAWAVASLFVIGFVVPLVGEWTGPILGVWFMGTQKPRRGFLWLAAFILLPNLLTDWRSFPLTSPTQALEYLGWMLLAAMLIVLPFLFHRLVSPRLPGIVSTLPLALAAVALHTIALAWKPGGILSLYSIFLIDWFAAVVVWMWNNEFRASKIGVGASLFGVMYTLAAGFEVFRQFTGAALPDILHAGVVFGWSCLGGAAALSIWAFLNPEKRRLPWASRPGLALLQSPYTGEPLHMVGEQGGEALVSPSGERFPIRDGIPNFLKAEEITGSNRKYNHLYETIGGFYDDTQRVIYALRGVEQDAHFLSYLPLLEIKAGDLVLETSVGTGLNFKYLPRGIKLFGLDLSPEMLTSCHANLRRWQLEADLLLGNAESLPFADCSFDVVFHVGGINFFNDRFTR